MEAPKFTGKDPETHKRLLHIWLFSFNFCFCFSWGTFLGTPCIMQLLYITYDLQTHRVIICGDTTDPRRWDFWLSWRCFKLHKECKAHPCGYYCICYDQIGAWIKTMWYIASCAYKNKGCVYTITYCAHMITSLSGGRKMEYNKYETKREGKTNPNLSHRILPHKDPCPR